MKIEITKAKQLSKYFCDLKPGEVFSLYEEFQNVLYVKTKNMSILDCDSNGDDAIVNCLDLYTFDAYLFDNYEECFLFEAKIAVTPIYNGEEK